jgi:farnesyl-diphosphate farnesyltransferase
MTEIDALLQTTSRTIALAIPLLPEPTGTEVGVAALLFRILGTLEKRTDWSSARRVEALTELVELLDGPPEAANATVSDWTRELPGTHAEHGKLDRKLLEEIPSILRAFQRLRRDARVSIRRHVARSAHEMGMFVSRSDGANEFELATLEDLRRYCYVGAGIVGEMLTELFLLDRPKLAPIAQDLEGRAAAFGEGLRLVDLLKAAQPDQRDQPDPIAGRVYLPRGVDVGEILALAKADLAIATAYTRALRAGGAEPGLVAFNAFLTELALANLAVLRDYGPGSGLSRLEVAKIALDVVERMARPRNRFRAPLADSPPRVET